MNCEFFNNKNKLLIVSFDTFFKKLNFSIKIYIQKVEFYILKIKKRLKNNFWMSKF